MYDLRIFSETLKEVNLGSKNNRERITQKQIIPHQKTLDMLYDFFRPYNTLLAQYLGDDGFLWEYRSDLWEIHIYAYTFNIICIMSSST